MSYINFKGTVKKINLKSAEETEITISIPASELDGQYNTLQSMLELKVIGGLDSQIVTYKVLKNAKTGKPITKYTVDGSGVVSTAEPEGEQLSLDLGLPAEKVEVKADPEQIDLEIIQEFILSGLAPRFDDIDYDFHEITERLASGDTYLKIAADIGMGVGVFVVMVDEYRKRVAPMAAKWNEWREGQGQPAPAAAEPTAETEGDQPAAEKETEQDEDEKSDGNADLEPEWLQGDGQVPPADQSEQESRGAEGDGSSDSGEAGDGEEADGTDAVEANEGEVSKEELDAFILADRPIFPEVEYDGQPVPFPDLLEKRLKENKVWREIANENGMTSGQLSSRYSVYRKLAEKKMKGGGGAA
ncbi:hypothetical protein GCM10010912_30040 [Paenibacillus albidus]|uniref:2-methylcitrate dehydratase n=1 Tax=Paenibacillus albidus TaxID=2041023 RepID=A0A917CCF9_9BACL|nr:hypothetical protein [Paenibacillus albidus]GGF82926.1 hypothetical protein GCM10010912_30040 [Paenibacillus albidus]